MNRRIIGLLCLTVSVVNIAQHKIDIWSVLGVVIGIGCVLLPDEKEPK